MNIPVLKIKVVDNIVWNIDSLVSQIYMNETSTFKNYNIL